MADPCETDSISMNYAGAIIIFYLTEIGYLTEHFGTLLGEPADYLDEVHQKWATATGGDLECVYLETKELAIRVSDVFFLQGGNELVISILNNEEIFFYHSLNGK